MSFRTAVGVILVTLAGLYLFVVPMIKISPNPLERFYVPHFILIGIFGVLNIYAGLTEKPIQTP